MPSYRLTVRHGSAVERERFHTLDGAVEALERHAGEVRREGPLDEVRSLRDFEPGEQVHARLKLSVGGLLHGGEAGVDVMGDGALVAYAGTIRKRRLELRRGQSPFDAVREALK